MVDLHSGVLHVSRKARHGLLDAWFPEQHHGVQQALPVCLKWPSSNTFGTCSSESLAIHDRMVLLVICKRLLNMPLSPTCLIAASYFA